MCAEAQQASGLKRKCRGPQGQGDYSGEIDILLCAMKEPSARALQSLSLSLGQVMLVWDKISRLAGSEGEVQTDPAAPSALKSLAHLWDQVLHLRAMPSDVMCLTVSCRHKLELPKTSIWVGRATLTLEFQTWNHQRLEEALSSLDQFRCSWPS